ncbi:hypothetical protein Ciccas_006526 [Cichlidogyrus casuarinus]|uniref:Uncharacterized protein n=1 Tax=Cichlidogyrus casuarinus TaxID=1844966 RepID=A0ABD2Q5H5_9PLAT
MHNELLRLSPQQADAPSSSVEQSLLFTVMEEFNIPSESSTGADGDSCKNEFRSIPSPFLADFGDEHLRTPLILAAQNNHIGAIELLLSPIAMGVTDKSQNIGGLTVTKFVLLLIRDCLLLIEVTLFGFDFKSQAFTN